MSNITLILHNIRSVHNVGSIFRTADAAGVSNIILSGYTPTSIDRFGMPRKDFIKVSLGAENTVKWSQIKRLAPTLEKLKKDGHLLLAIEQDKRSISLFAWRPTDPKQPLAIILGNERRGISKTILDKTDVILEIPMHGKKESLNVSVAAGVALFQVMR